MDFESQQAIDILNAQNDYIDEEETTIPENSTCSTLKTQPVQVKRKRCLTSHVWNDFTSVGFGEDGKERGECRHCGAQLVITRTHGTKHLIRHLEKCPKIPKKKDKDSYDPRVDREMISEIIIYHDLPFRYVEYEKVRDRDKYLNSECQHICRQTAAVDVFKRYEIEKEKLKEVFAKHLGRVSFTSDLWSACTTMMRYICLTAHFIDDSWRLNSKILAFCELKCPHSGEEIAKKILECLREWGLEKKVFSLTLDNATNNDRMLKILKGRLQMISSGSLLCDGKFMHVRCCAHILNLIVKEGLELAKDVLHSIRESVKYVKASPHRKELFAACVEREGIKSGAGLSLDVPTRWNSAYEMLSRALRFRKAFVSLKEFDTSYKTLPSENEWDRGEKICDLLKPFSVITNHFSGSKYPTSNVYFTQVWRIQLLLKKYASCDDQAVREMVSLKKYAFCDDQVVREMVSSMQAKFDKYWEDYSLILSMGAVFDPRLKLQMLEASYEMVDPTTSSSKLKDLKENLDLLYKEYKSKPCESSSRVSTTPTPHELLSESPLDDDFDIDLFELESSIGVRTDYTKSHLEVYLNEPRLERRSFPKLDVLNYWKENQHRFGDLASMACDILSIPITTVASESAFSIGARVLTPYRNRLLPNTVQALLCTRNWLRGFAEYAGDLEENNEAENEP